MIDKIEPNKLIQAIAKKLESVIDQPEWSKFVKTGTSKQRPPIQDDWWFIRAASVLRAIEQKGPIGVSKLRIKYGGRKNLGVRPEHFKKGSGKIIRIILQQLEEAKLVKYETKGVHKGRVITNEGKTLLFSTSKELIPKEKKSSETKSKEMPKKVEEPKHKEIVNDSKEQPKIKEAVSDSKEQPKNNEAVSDSKETPKEPVSKKGE
jgi:small subunit ribosomal protein S19e